MSVSLVIKEPTLAKIGEIVLDASIDETHSYYSKVSQYPVENGATISDNIYNEPEKVTVKGVVTSTPVKDTSMQSNPFEGKARAAYFDLINLRNNKQPVNIVTGLVSYSNMVLTSLTIPRNVEVGEALEFTAEFTKINTVSSVTVPASSLGSNAKQAASKTSGGNQTAQSVPPEKGTSVLKKITDAGANAFFGALNR